MNFELLLFLAALFTGLVWLLDALLFAGGRKRALVGDQEPGEPVLVEYSRSFFPVLLIVFLLRGFLVEPFRIPSGSMLPTLLVGDFILVNKFVYGVRLPVTKWKLLAVDDPQRGDVAVFRYPGDPSIDYIKRIVGIPGDTIRYRDKQLYLNGKPVPRSLLEWIEGEQRLVFSENLAGYTHLMQHLNDRRLPDLEGEWVVPDGSYFVMGDNRDNSLDSRKWRFVPEGNLVGKAFMIWMSWDAESWGIHWRRIGDSIR